MKGIRKIFRWAKVQHVSHSPLGKISHGDLRRLKPVGGEMGYERGLPIDRYYLEQFLNEHRGDIGGAVLEIGDPTYTKKFGNRVSNSDVLHVTEGIPEVTIVGDLATGEGIPRNQFDCIILTQTLNVIYDFPAAIRNCFMSLKENGVLLATMPGISQVSRTDMDSWGDYWRFTSLSARRVFGEVFQENRVTVSTYGNVLSAVSFLHGLASSELNREELEYRDPDYEVLIGIRAAKGGNAGS